MTKGNADNDCNCQQQKRNTYGDPSKQTGRRRVNYPPPSAPSTGRNELAAHVFGE